MASRVRMRLPSGSSSSRRSFSIRRASPASTTHSSGCESKRALASRRSSESAAGLISCASSMSSTGRRRVRLEVGQPALAQGLEAAPAVVRAQRHAEEVAQLAVEVGQVALRMVEGADGDVGQARQALGEQAQRHALAGARVAVDHGEAALADLRVLDAPAEVLELGRHVERLGRQLGREGIPLQPVQGQQFLVHAGRSWVSVDWAGQIGRRQAGGGVLGEQLAQQRRDARGRQWRQVWSSPGRGAGAGRRRWRTCPAARPGTGWRRVRASTRSTRLRSQRA